MTDIVDPKTRSRMMSGIKSKDTKPELIIRQGLHKKGFRFRLHDRSLPGKPDIVLRKYKAVILVNGCFWHGHNCSLFKWPSTRTEFWKNKIGSTRKRDREIVAKLIDLEWRVLIIWECALKGKNQQTIDEVICDCSNWIKLNSTRAVYQIPMENYST